MERKEEKRETTGRKNKKLEPRERYHQGEPPPRKPNKPSKRKRKTKKRRKRTNRKRKKKKSRPRKRARALLLK